MNMRYHRYTTLAVILVLIGITFASCDKYLDVTPKGYTLLQTVADYDQWLNDPAIAINIPTQLDILGDNADIPAIPTPASTVTELIYTWGEQFSSDLNLSPVFWGAHYSNINKYNTVLEGVDQATGGTEQQKSSLKAEALLGRAFEYLYLINEYGQPYDAATAAQDPGVPFVASHQVTQTVPSRGTVEQVYERIITDINAALPSLPAQNTQNRFRPDVAAAYSVLARVYLYKRDYANAKLNAELALQRTGATMLDYNALPANEPKNTAITVKADVIYGRSAVAIPMPTLEFLNTYDRQDQRFKWFRTTDGYKARGNTLFAAFISFPFFTNTNYGTSVQEMKLIIAEAAARNNDLATALQQLNEIRLKRFPASVYQPLQSADAAIVLGWVLRERTFEFPFHGLRWFDMRRLDKEGRMPAVSRYDAKGNIVATLQPHSPRYTLQIPVQVLRFNPDMKQNP
ncbi:RagB/SusD family nutrient uptake outer membrane protein [Pedobacter faecalis]|uniref:RagB/SusD family nutrient uptake outer membrane protein n=1 Tax=Pedobacter faecalis TaxID=3041495 RepID=UPI002550DE33|nr:RagB/SusD family nutrient uptake outer membrane protein [Pedobacter sp. ELA7]